MTLPHADTPGAALTSRPWGVVEWVLGLAVLGAYGGMTFFGVGANTSLIPAIITLGAGYVLVFIHGGRRYGWRKMVFFFVITWIVSNAFENLSILTGFPFGNYFYTGEPKIALVPWFIGLAYFLFGYGAWTLTSTLLGRADAQLDLRTRRGRVNLILLPAFSGVVMTLWDLAMDSRSSTIQRGWVWEDGGHFFGVPVQNYFGWVFVTWFFFQIFTIVLALPQTRGVAGSDVAKSTASGPPILIYLSTGIAAVGTFFATRGGTETVADAAGNNWRVADIDGSLMLIAVLTVVALSVVGLAKILRGDER